MTAIQYVFTLFLYLLGALLLAVAAFPAFLFGLWLYQAAGPATPVAKAAVLAVGAGVGFFIFGISLVAATVVFRFAFGLKLKEGEYPFFSPQGFKWAFVNATFLIVKFTFMDFMKVTPLLPLYYRLMGAKIGPRVQINSTNLGDISLLEIGEDTVIGGEAVIIGHLAEHGKLKLKKLRIGRKVTIGLGCVIMPGCEIGDHSLIAARSVLPKYTVVPPHSLFAGTPAKLIKTLEK